MFIVRGARVIALRQEGHVILALGFTIDMALLTEGRRSALLTINMALLTEGDASTTSPTIPTLGPSRDAQ